RAHRRPGAAGVRRRTRARRAARRRLAARRRPDRARPARPAAAWRDVRPQPVRHRLMPRARRQRRLLAVLLAGMLAPLLAAPAPAPAQSSREAERKLEKVQRELKDVAAERRRIEGRRGDASRRLREADEKVGDSTRSLRETEAELARRQAELARLRERRDGLQSSLAQQRGELGELLRAAYAIGDQAPLKLMLSQDQVAEASRALTYHRYLQRDRMRRIQSLSAQLAELERVEREIAQQQQALDAARERQRAELAEL